MTKRTLIGIIVLLIIITGSCFAISSEYDNATITVIVSKRIELSDIIKGLRQCAGFENNEYKLDIKDLIIMINTFIN